jgi:hypothetical protein
MPAETEQLERQIIPAGARPITASWPDRLRIPPIPVRNLVPGEPPTSVRARFGWSVGEVSGSLGDLGTFLPHIVGAITVVGMAPTGILTTFGLFYALSGAFYGVPMAVQPMKAASAAVLIEPMAPGAIARAGIVIGAFFLLIGATGVVSRLARILPATIAAGLQLGLGLSLAGLGVRLMEKQLWLGIAASAFMLVLMRYRRVPVALAAVIAGIVLGQILGMAPPFRHLDFGLHLPKLTVPSWAQIVHGTSGCQLLSASCLPAAAAAIWPSPPARD